MYNCYFEDADLYFNAKPESFICKDSDGFFIKIRILSKMVIVELLKLQIVPIYENDIFYIKVYLTNGGSTIRINGLPLGALSEKYSDGSKIKKITIKEAAIRRYSEDHPKSIHAHGRACYAKRLLLNIKSE